MLAPLGLRWRKEHLGRDDEQVKEEGLKGSVVMVPRDHATVGQNQNRLEHHIVPVPPRMTLLIDKS